MKIPAPWRTALDLVANSGLSGSAEDIVELIEESADALQKAHLTGYVKALRDNNIEVPNQREERA